MAAVACLEDHARTAAFIDGVNQAIKNLPQDREVRLAEVGSGPIAPIALCTMLAHPHVTCDAVDINPESTAALKAILEILKIDDSRFRIHTEDVTQGTWTHARPHIIVSETLDAGLLDEPYGAIAAHLAPQFSSSVIWLPQRVEVTR